MLETGRGQDFGQVGSARLLAGFAGDADPPFASFGRGFEEAFFGTGGLERQDPFGAQLSGFLDDPFEGVKLDERGAQGDAHRRRHAIQRFDHAKPHAIAVGRLDAREIGRPVVGDFVKLALFGAENAGEMAGVRAAKLRGLALYRVDEESPACQKTIVMGRRALQYRLMIALLRGILIEKHPNQAIVETGGVGYDVAIPVSTFTRLPDAGVEVRLRIHTHVREDALALYGFLTQDEKALFEKLIGVGGIGPTLAVKILSGLAAADVIHAIRRGEVEKLVRIPGVGKKTAERMVLELREKLPAVSGEEAETAASETLSLVDQDVLSALLNLGCARPHAEAAVRKAKASGAAEFEPLFRRALELVR